jgi:succinate dehydrogenase/fumarate reductase cytochrome b subunit
VTTLVIIAFLVVIVYNLGAGLFYMMTDKGQTDRTLNALKRRIGLSVLLILLVILGILTGIIQPHGLPGAPAK